jgi:hypothetical protein
MVNCNIGVRQTVEPTAHTYKFAFFAKLSEVLVMKSLGTYLSSTNDP